MARQLDFESKLKFGQQAEQWLERWIAQKYGWAILPVYEGGRENKGPRLIVPNSHNLILPDLLAIRANEARWIEVKRKSIFSWHRKYQYWSTGIDRRSFDHYIEVRKRSPWHLFLMFLHAPGVDPIVNKPCPSGLFASEITKLAEALKPNSTIGHTYDRYGKGGMVYWRMEAFQKLATYEEVTGISKDAA